MAALLIRKATQADLPRIGEIWYEAAIEGEANPPPYRGVPSLYAHELATGELFVLERDQEVAAYAAVVNRGSIAFLADLFVAAAHRSAGLGQRLLGAVLPTDGRLCCTVASNDPRALPLYARSGMRPWWPQLTLRGLAGELGPLSSANIQAIEADPDDADWLRCDTEISRRPRPEDRKYWIARRHGVPLWFTRGGRRVGYGMAQLLSDDWLWDSDAVTLGPIGAFERAEAVGCVLAAVEWARRRAAIHLIRMTGPHAAILPLLSAGFRIVGVETFCSTAETPFVDVQRYVPSGGDLF
jgi:GNAT superfamily N-acetyltransferase